MTRRGWIVLAAMSIVVGCAKKPPPRTCSIEAPPKEEKGPLEIGMCTTDAPSPVGAPDAAPAEATTDGG